MAKFIIPIYDPALTRVIATDSHPTACSCSGDNRDACSQPAKDMTGGHTIFLCGHSVTFLVI